MKFKSFLVRNAARRLLLLELVLSFPGLVSARQL
jgi:hypothetical protein